MSERELNIAYNARLSVPDHEEIAARWAAAAQAYRGEADAELDIAYGPGAREQYDFFPAGAGSPLCAYIHGGYWRSRDRKMFSHIAKGLNARGISVAIPSYDLVPHVSLMTIIEQMRAFVVRLWQNTGRKPFVAGHSAGGHLSAAMLASDWAGVAGAPDDLVKCGFAFSGLYDLRPLLELDVNDDIRLDEKSARAASPLFWPAPREGLRLIAPVGALESDVFVEQSRRLAQVWSEAGFETDFFEVPDCNHFTIVDAVSTPGGMLFERLVSEIEAHEG